MIHPNYQTMDFSKQNTVSSLDVAISLSVPSRTAAKSNIVAKSRAPEFYGFVAWASTSALFFVYILWALLPDECIVTLGVDWYPNRSVLLHITWLLGLNKNNPPVSSNPSENGRSLSLPGPLSLSYSPTSSIGRWHYWEHPSSRT